MSDAAEGQVIVALLGRCSEPTDGVRDYCACLSAALAQRGIRLEIVSLDWIARGWPAARRDLAKRARDWRGRWVLLQYTAMMWSRRGFPLRVLGIARILRRSGVRVAVVFHEPIALSGTRWVDRVRGWHQSRVIRKLHGLAGRSIVTEPLAKLAWLPPGEAKAAFIPIGSNVPERSAVARPAAGDRNKTVAIFCLDEPPHRRMQLDEIAYAVRTAQRDGLKVTVAFVGKGTDEARAEIASALDPIAASVTVAGIQEPAEISRILSGSDAFLSVRGPLYMRRGTAIAGIACGLPIVSYAGPIEGTPMHEAGLELVPYRDKEALAQALKHVLEDESHAAALGQRSERAYATYFCWDAIAASLLKLLGEGAAA